MRKKKRRRGTHALLAPRRKTGEKESDQGEARRNDEKFSCKRDGCVNVEGVRTGRRAQTCVGGAPPHGAATDNGAGSPPQGRSIAGKFGWRAKR